VNSTVTPLTTADARTHIAAARRAVGQAEVPVSITVLDAGGHLLAYCRAERAVLVSGETSTARAYTALQLNAPTAEVADLVKPGGPFHSLPTAAVSSSAPSGSVAALPSGTTAPPRPRPRSFDQPALVPVSVDQRRLARKVPTALPKGSS
jgi:uncharacterized protein GlcG (DUF336 family)